jgi:dipeptidyl aminopeptidase/acylaminoacyl peptidase
VNGVRARRQSVGPAQAAVAALLVCFVGGPTPAQDGATPVEESPAPVVASRALPPRIPAEVFARNPDFWDPVLSPDGTRVLARATVGGRERIVVHSFETGKGSLLPKAEDAQIDWYDWAGERRVLLCVGRTESVAGEDFYVTRVIVIDLATGGALVLGDKHGGLEGDDVLYVDPKGEWLLLSMQQTLDEYPAVFRYDLETGKRTVAVKPRDNVWAWYVDNEGVVRAGLGFLARSWFMLYRPDGNEAFRNLGQVAYDDRPAGFALLGLASGSNDGYVLSDEKTGRNALYRFNFETQELGEVVHENPTNDVDDFWTSRDGRRVTAVSYTDDRERMLWLDPTMRAHQEKLEASFPGQDVIFVTGVEARGRFIVWVGGAADPGSYYLFTQGSNQLQRIARFNEKLDPALLAPTEYARYKARDGLDIPAYLTLPVGREPMALPLIVLPHGGPYFVRDMLAYDPDVQFLANRGFVVLQPNFRGSSGYGAEFAAKGEGQWGRAMQDDLDDGVDWLAQRGIVDPNRVCVVGTSYGGYAALWAVTRNPERYRCAASLAGVTDVGRQLRYVSGQLSGSERIEWQETVRGEKRFDLGEVSPLEQVGRLTRPVLVAHGDADRTVLFKQSTLYRDALQKAAKPHVFVAYAGEGHGLEDPAHLADWYDRLESFLQTYNPAQQPARQ